jgi:predicted dehydrogenase
MGIDAARLAADPLTMLKDESRRTDGADAVAIMAPNDSHFQYASAALKLGFHVICDKPMTNTLDEARELHALARASGKVFCLTHNYTGYPLVRQARAMVAGG